MMGEDEMLKLLRRDRAFYRRLVALTVPMLLQNLISSSAGMVDTLMVGMLGQTELSGVSLANTPFFVAMLFVFGLQSGGAVLTSQYWGKRDVTTINRVMGISWYLACIISTLFATVVFLFPDKIMSITTNNSALLAVAVRYGRIVAFSYALNSFVMVFTGTMRSCEQPLVGTTIVIMGMFANVFFNWMLIFGKLGAPAMGVEGAALGTLLARVVELLLVVAYLIFYKKKPFKMDIRRILRPGRMIFSDYIKYSLPVMINETLWGAGASTYPIIYGHMAASTDIVAAHAVSGNIEKVVTIAVFSLAHTAAIMVGKEIGAGGKKKEVTGLGKTIAALATTVGLASGLLLLGMLFTVIRPYLFPLFSLSASAERIATVMLAAMSAVMMFRSFNCTLIVGILRGGGDVKFGMFLDIGSMYMWSIPLGFIAGLVLKLDITVVFLLIISEEVIKSAIGFLRFRSGKWVRNVTREMVK